MLLLLHLLKKIFILILSKKFVLIESKFNENTKKTSQKTWKKGKTWQMAPLLINQRTAYQSAETSIGNL